MSYLLLTNKCLIKEYFDFPRTKFATLSLCRIAYGGGEMLNKRIHCIYCYCFHIYASLGLSMRVFRVGPLINFMYITFSF